jgi:hypothetical protein
MDDLLKRQEIGRKIKINLSSKTNLVNRIILKSLMEQKNRVTRTIQTKKTIDKGIQVTDTTKYLITDNSDGFSSTKGFGGLNTTATNFGNSNLANTKFLMFNTKTCILPYIKTGNEKGGEKFMPYYFENIIKRKKKLKIHRNETFNSVITNSYNSTID